MLLKTAYFPPIEYFAMIARYSVRFDGDERYEKQSWRNRCRILTSNGPEDLRVPIVHNGSYGIREVLVDYSTPWVRRTEYAIESAYSSSPFYIYYKDGIFSILDSCPATLWELNSRLTEHLCLKLGLMPNPALPEGEERDIHPKHPSSYVCRPYWQVFRDKFGFVPGLSVLDLLFNEGPESICCL